jgi:hypothetical protein
LRMCNGSVDASTLFTVCGSESVWDTHRQVNFFNLRSWARISFTVVAEILKCRESIRALAKG